MEAGAELDARIAEKVMGWHKFMHTVGWCWESADGILLRQGFKPSTDISDAWLIVDKLTPTHGIELSQNSGDSEWYCRLTDRYQWTRKFWAFAATAPMAICLAGLKVKGVES